jgi:hypothetical protein
MGFQAASAVQARNRQLNHSKGNLKAGGKGRVAADYKARNWTEGRGFGRDLGNASDNR